MKILTVAIAGLVASTLFLDTAWARQAEKVQSVHNFAIIAIICNFCQCSATN
ncbi:hypothetical protein H6F44_10280 [Pseudanabaena sp. FACHB-1277]|jgi:hypothetical protein|uniref:Uncharacterized protein n=1 Tax=Pseudanabaena cinerea FACHB-1277 TaxID=2949581 RepID=A0A926UTE5_9CYAN|nr:hypothetical protein [Pseudanabaena cinerea]MBD2150503.1 hypothetical protein [Pseudanabaena cinerea FACHB-1277]